MSNKTYASTFKYLYYRDKFHKGRFTNLVVYMIHGGSVTWQMYHHCNADVKPTSGFSSEMYMYHVAEIIISRIKSSSHIYDIYNMFKFGYFPATI